MLVVTVALLLAGAVPPAGGATGGASAGGAGAPGASGVDGGEGIASLDAAPMAQQAENNTTVRHRDPESVEEEEGNLAGIQRRLGGQMRNVTVDCSQGIQVGDFDACEDLNGSYSDSLSKYVEVTGGGDTNGSRTAEEYRDLREGTSRLASQVQRFRETHRAYREARANGNTSRARRLARDMLTLEERIQRTGADVTSSADAIANRTDRSSDDIRENTRAVTANVTNTTRTVADAMFVRTGMTATRSGAGPVSAEDPLVVTGRVRTENGSTVRNGSVVLATGPGPGAAVLNRTRAHLNESGGYELSYRPTAIRPGNRTLSLRYQPPPTSVYREANASVNATVERVRVALAVRSTPERLRYNESMAVGATVATAGDESVALGGAPLALRIDGRTLTTNRTGRNGTTQLRARLPAEVANGTRPLTVGVPSGGERAVTVESVERQVRIRSTATTLDLRTVETAPGARSVRVTGRLTAREGGVPGQSVAVRVDDQLVSTPETNATGHYRGTVTVPNASYPASGRAAVGVVAAFDGTGTNLEATRARQEVTLGSGGTASSDGELNRLVGFARANPTVTGAGAVATVGLLAGAGFLLVRRRRERDAGESPAEGASASAPGVSGGRGGAASGAAVGPDVETVREALSEGAYTRTILSGYAALRGGLSVGASPAVTYWEFYRQASEAGLPESQLDALRDVTEAFERVSFAGEAPDEETAVAVLERVRAALGEGESGVDAAGADD